MHTFKIFVLGLPGSATAAFVQAARELQEGSREHNYSHPYNFGRIVMADESVLYLFAWSRNFNMQFLVETLAPTTFKDVPDLGQILEKFSLADVSDTGVIVIIDSANPEMDQANKNLLQNIQYLAQHKRFPYIVAFNRKHLPTARTPHQMREALTLLDSIKVLGCDLKDSSSTKKVVLELLLLTSQNEKMQPLIEGLKAKI